MLEDETYQCHIVTWITVRYLEYHWKEDYAGIDENQQEQWSNGQENWISVFVVDECIAKTQLSLNKPLNNPYVGWNLKGAGQTSNDQLLKFGCQHSSKTDS
jgi:hypothetical protein